MEQTCRNHQKSDSKPTCRWWIGVACAVALGMVIGRNSIAPVAVVDGSSMAPNYPPGERLRTAAISGPLRRGDVVLIDEGDASYAVKRLIGLPGETVHIWRGQVFINGQMLVEPYLRKNTYTYPIERKYLGAVFTVGEDQYFVLGDNRLQSADSREYGPVPRDRIKRLVPLPEGFVRAHLTQHRLPVEGRSLIEPL